MRNRFQRILLVLAVNAAFVACVLAQNGGPHESKTMPFGDGETLTYEGKISKYISGITIADLTFTITRPETGDNYLVKADAKSKGTLLKFFRFSFLYQIDSTIEDKEFRIKKTVKRDTQKERVRESEAIFDYGDNRVTYVETDPKDLMRPSRKIASEIGPETHDLVSGLYRLRMLPIAVGKTFELTISDSGLVYKIPVKVTARERQKTVLGQIWCLRVEPDIFGPDRLIEKEGSMVIWVTDDARHLPVRSLVNSSVGKIDIRLKSAKNLKT
jgi:Protein of unknown function (DUF3108)